MMKLFLLLACLSACIGFRLARNVGSSSAVGTLSSLSCAPSDTGDDDDFNGYESLKVPVAPEEVNKMKCEISTLASLCNRGELGHNKDKMLSLCSSLEASQDSVSDTSMLMGTWNLLYSSSYLFKSSPFFMAARAVCKEGDEADRFNFFCKLHREALLFTQIGEVKQIISVTSLVSEFESLVAAVPGLPVTIKGVIQSSSDIEVAANGDMSIAMDTVKIKSGTSNIPFADTFLDNIALRTRTISDFLESNIDSYSTPRPLFRTTFLSDTFRISRDQDDNVFVYVKD